MSTLVASPTSLALSWQVGSAAPAPLTITTTVSPEGGAANPTFGVSPGGAGWLTISVSGDGWGPWWIAVTANPAAANLTPGTYTPNVIIEDWETSGISNPQLVIPVTLTVVAAGGGGGGSGTIQCWVESPNQKIRDQDAVPSPAVTTATVKGAGGEFVPFQIGVKGGPLTGVSAVASTLLGGGNTIPAPRLYRVGLVNVPQKSGDPNPNLSDAQGPGWFPDPLVPDYDEFDGQKRAAFPFATPNASASRAIWVDLFIPPGTPAGTYSGTVTVSATGQTPTTIPIALTVWPFSLPATSSLRSFFGAYAGDAAQGFGYAAPSSALTAMIKRVIAAGLDHRISIASLQDSTDNTGAGTYARFAEFINGTSPLTRLVGARLTSIPTRGPDYAEWVAAAKASGFFDRLINYDIDEPQNGVYGSWSRLVAVAAGVRAADPNAKVLVTANIDEAVAANATQNIDIICPVIDQLFGNNTAAYAGWKDHPGNHRADYESWRTAKAGREVWMYHSNDSNWNIANPSYAIDEPALRARKMPWLSWLYSATGTLYWDTTWAWGETPARNEWTSPLSSLFGNSGDGALFYRGRPSQQVSDGASGTVAFGGTTDVPVPSIRLKLTRQGMQDYEYLKLAAAVSAAQTQTIAAGLFPNPWTDPALATFDAQREALGALIASAVSAGAPPPTIQSFAASPATVYAGQTVTLSWQTTGATSLSIAGIGTVVGTSCTVSPTATTTYVLSASSASGTASASLTVSVSLQGGGVGGGIQTVIPPLSPPAPPLPIGIALALRKPGVSVLCWVEIEGLRYAYGNRALPGSFWASLPLAQRFDALRSLLSETPVGVDAKLDPLEGIAQSGEFEFRVVDDGYLIQSANVGREAYDTSRLYLKQPCAGTDTTLAIAGDTSSWPASGIAYLGRTTLSYAGKTASAMTGVVQGLYRSAVQSHAQGEGLTLYPPFLARRRCWYSIAAQADGAPFSIAYRIPRYAGIIDEYPLESGGGVWALKVRTDERAFQDARIFRGLRSGTLASALPGA